MSSISRKLFWKKSLKLIEFPWTCPCQIGKLIEAEVCSHLRSWFQSNSEKSLCVCVGVPQGLGSILWSVCGQDALQILCVTTIVVFVYVLLFCILGVVYRQLVSRKYNFDADKYHKFASRFFGLFRWNVSLGLNLLKRHHLFKALLCKATQPCVCHCGFTERNLWFLNFFPSEW